MATLQGLVPVRAPSDKPLTCPPPQHPSPEAVLPPLASCVDHLFLSTVGHHLTDTRGCPCQAEEAPQRQERSLTHLFLPGVPSTVPGSYQTLLSTSPMTSMQGYGFQGRRKEQEKGQGPDSFIAAQQESAVESQKPYSYLEDTRGVWRGRLGTGVDKMASFGHLTLPRFPTDMGSQGSV